MAHWSEDNIRLEVKKIKGKMENITCLEPDVSFINLPYYSMLSEVPEKEKLYDSLTGFIKKTHEEAVIAILCSPLLATDYCAQMPEDAHLKLWVTVKLETPIERKGFMAQHHLALLILTRYKGALKHTKTRIGYTYCPFCERTTKDYGGKKHLYHGYGTLMSDIWRDISVKLNEYPEVIVDRLQDLFGLEPYKRLNILDQREYYKAVALTNGAVEAQTDVNEFEYEGQTGSVLINEDCLDALKKMPGNSVDFAFADPPYNLKKKYESWDDGIDIQEYFEWCDQWLTEMARVLKPGRTCAVLNIPQWCIRHFKHLQTVLDFQDWIVWEGLSLPVRMIMPAHYTTLCFSKGKPRPLPGLVRDGHSFQEDGSQSTIKEFYCARSSCVKTRRRMGTKDTEPVTNIWWDIHRLKHNSRRVDHPCQLPPMFMYRLIALFTNEGEYVLDPFDGAGTTSLTTKQLNRQYIGIELSEYYHTITKKRHQELEGGLDPFRKNDATPKAKNSYVKRIKKQKYSVSKKV